MTSWVLVRSISVFLLLAASVSATRASEPFDHAGLARRALEQHIRPGYANFAEATRGMSGALSDCSAGQPADRDRAAAAFFALVAAWGKIEHIQFGPIGEERRLERVLFWPDRRGLALKQVQRITATRDASALEATSLAAKSVAVQGLGALEELLFGATLASTASADRVFVCRYAAAIADNLTRIAHDVVAGWADGSAHTQDWLTAGTGSKTYLAAVETTALLTKAYTNGLERMRDERIAGPLGYGKTRRPTGVLFEKSGRPMEILVANSAGLIALFVDGGMRDAVAATNLKHEHINIEPNLDLVLRELKTAAATFEEFRSSKRPFDDEKSRQRIIAVGFPLKNANIQASALLALTAGVTLGFNASDGD